MGGDDRVSQGAERERNVEMRGEVVSRRVARRRVVDDRTSAASREVEECDQVGVDVTLPQTDRGA